MWYTRLKLEDIEMTVAHRHPEYTAMLDKWLRCIDVCKGQDAVHAAGSSYLPRLSDQTDAEYLAYKNRTPFYNASWRTVVGLQGMLFRKPPKVIVPGSVKEMLEDINQSGTSLHILALEVVEECLKLGRVGIMVDFPAVSESATLADAKLENHRPAMKLCKATSIINWKTSTIKNRTVLSMIVLEEEVDVQVDEFQDKAELQYRVLDLVQSEAGEIYRVRVFKVDAKSGKEFLKEGPFYPKVNGKNLNTLPFQFIGVDDVSWTVDEPPLIDLVDMNLSHYRTTADYEHGCHFTGLPTPVVTGYISDASNPEKFCIGSTTAWVFPRPEAKAFFLEFTGVGLNSLKENLERKEGYMAILGARMLEVDVKGGVESANTAALHRGGEQSMLSSVGQAVSMGFAKALETFCEFAGATGEVVFELNRDFFPVPMDALTLTSIIAGWQNGAYSYESMLKLLQKGEMVDPETTVEQEKEKIAEHPYVPPIDPNVEVTPGEKSPKADATPATPAPTGTQLRKPK
jgi:hypothetical protein